MPLADGERCNKSLLAGGGVPLADGEGCHGRDVEGVAC